jgi:hypothetical protein
VGLGHRDWYRVSRAFVLFGAQLGGQFLSFDAMFLGEPVAEVDQLTPLTAERSIRIRLGR